MRPLGSRFRGNDVLGGDDVLGGGGRVVGIEVKTSAGSVKEGQLEGYLKRFTEKYSEDRIAMAYLTPFNRERVNRLRADADARALSSVREFEEFAGEFSNARHLSWLDIADIEWQGGDSWRQHREYVRNYVAPESRLGTMISRDRSLDEFFGESAAEEFWDELGRAGVDVQAKEEGVRIDLEKFEGDPQALTGAIEILILRGEGVSGTEKLASSRANFVVRFWTRITGRSIALCSIFRSALAMFGRKERRTMVCAWRIRSTLAA